MTSAVFDDARVRAFPADGEVLVESSSGRLSPPTRACAHGFWPTGSGDRSSCASRNRPVTGAACDAAGAARAGARRRARSPPGAPPEQDELRVERESELHDARAEHRAVQPVRPARSVDRGHVELAPHGLSWKTAEVPRPRQRTDCRCRSGCRASRSGSSLDPAPFRSRPQSARERFPDRSGCRRPPEGLCSRPALTRRTRRSTASKGIGLRRPLGGSSSEVQGRPDRTLTGGSSPGNVVLTCSERPAKLEYRACSQVLERHRSGQNAKIRVALNLTPAIDLRARARARARCWICCCKVSPRVEAIWPSRLAAKKENHDAEIGSSSGDVGVTWPLRGAFQGSCWRACTPQVLGSRSRGAWRLHGFDMPKPLSSGRWRLQSLARDRAGNQHPWDHLQMPRRPRSSLLRHLAPNRPRGRLCCWRRLRGLLPWERRVYQVRGRGWSIWPLHVSGSLGRF